MDESADTVDEQAGSGGPWYTFPPVRHPLVAAVIVVLTFALGLVDEGWLTLRVDFRRCSSVDCSSVDCSSVLY